jgi:nicotinamide-nucleotide amidase
MIHPLRLLIPKVASTLTQQHDILTTAESCTGGGLSYWLTSIPGSSIWFDRGFVTYSNQAKMDLLNVQAKSLQTDGAVSEVVAIEMAEGALQNSTANLSLSITGIAGPDGGSDEKPVGTVWISCSKKNMKTETQHFIFTGDRQHIRLQAIVAALELLLEYRV